jgi:hypothetical protein
MATTRHRITTPAGLRRVGLDEPSRPTCSFTPASGKPAAPAGKPPARPGVEARQRRPMRRSDPLVGPGTSRVDSGAVSRVAGLFLGGADPAVGSLPAGEPATGPEGQETGS